MPTLGAPGGPGASAGQPPALPHLGPPRQRTLPLHAIDFAGEDARRRWRQTGSAPHRSVHLQFNACSLNKRTSGRGGEGAPLLCAEQQ